jgi:putative ATP-dependent endonuclease of OLD family
MKLRRLEIQNFRGIKSLDWKQISAASALVGPGDSGKSTILDAVERVLSPRWNIPFDDTDFWDLATDVPIVVRATITDVPEALYQESKYGLAMHGFDEEKGEAVPAAGTDDEQQAIVIELRVEASLEPSWSVVDGEGQAHPITAKDRELLGMLRVGGTVDPHLSWGRGSVLTRLTEGGDAVGAVLADASRQARAGLKRDGLDRLADAARSVEEIGKALGVAPRTTFAPHLDVGSVSVATGALSLHDGEVPLRRAGLGTRRLLAVGIQREVAAAGGLTLIDEFEQGLEPHRIRRLLRVLRGRPPEQAVTTGQLLLTTHSPTVLSELSAEEIWVVMRNADGRVRVRSLPDALSFVLPRTPAALLARKVVVAEGLTEDGLCAALDEAWTDETGASFAYRGVAVVNGGGGTQHAEIAGALVSLGYEVALLTDSDAKAKTSRAKGASVLAWADGTATEERLVQDLPDAALGALVHLAVHGGKSGGARAVRDAIVDALTLKRDALDASDPDGWVEAVGADSFRETFGGVAKRKGWFKTRSLGRQLGKIVVENWEELSDTPTRAVLDELRSFAHDD